MIRLCFTHPFPERKLFPLGAQARGAFCACPRKNLSVTPAACHLPYRGEALAYRKASPLRQRLPYKGSWREAPERLYEGQLDREPQY